MSLSALKYYPRAGTTRGADNSPLWQTLLRLESFAPDVQRPIEYDEYLSMSFSALELYPLASIFRLSQGCLENINAGRVILSILRGIFLTILKGTFLMIRFALCQALLRLGSFPPDVQRGFVGHLESILATFDRCARRYVPRRARV